MLFSLVRTTALLVSLLIGQLGWASVVELKSSQAINLAPQLDILLDPGGDLSPFDVLNSTQAEQWHPNGSKVLNQGHRDDVFWLKFTLDAAQSVEKEWDLVLANSLLDYVDLYQVFDDAGPRLIHRQGAARPFDNRTHEHRFFIFPVEAYGHTTYLVRIDTAPSAVIPITAYPSGEFWAPLSLGDITNWLFYGILLAMVIYNTFLFLTIRDPSYLYYVLFVSSFGVLQLSLDGYLFQYFWWDNRGYDYRINFWLSSISVILAGLFIIHFLNLARISRSLVSLMAAVIAIQMLYVGLSFWVQPTRFALLFMPNLVGFMLLAVGFGLYAWYRGLVAARFFVLAWALFAAGNIAYLASRGGWLTLPFTPIMASKLGSALETMLLAFALAYRIRSLRDEHDRAQMRAEAQSYFLAQISHEIRTPLNGVLGMTEVLARTPLNPEQRGYVETIQGSGTSLLTLINDILDYSKIEAGKMELYREPVNLRRLAEQLLQLFKSQAEEKHLKLLLQVESEVPERVVLDAQRLRQVLSNLLSNAVKFTDQGSVLLTIAMASGAGGPQIVCRVKDTGIGIPVDRQGRLFSAYYQIEPQRRHTDGGTGLGLAICRQLVTLMGGEIDFISQSGIGSEFTLRVPYELPDTGFTDVDNKSVAASRSLNIMVAEDNVVNQKVITGLLEKLGHRVTIAANGTLAVERRKHPEFDFDLILMDCEMPEVDGYQATRAMRAFEAREGLPRVPIVALTAHALEEVRSRCLEAGMDDFLTKPINSRQLLRVLPR